MKPPPLPASESLPAPQNRAADYLLPFLLTLLPLLVIHFGWIFIQSRAFAWQTLDHQRQADRLLTAMESGWETRAHVKRQADTLYWFMERAVRIGASTSSMRQAIARHVGGFFPGSELRLFRFGNGEEERSYAPVFFPGDQGAASRKPGGGRDTGQRVFFKAFRFLLARNSGKSLPDAAEGFGKKAIISLFGQATLPDLLGTGQRGIPTRVVFQGRFFWLQWDTYQAPDGRGMGFFLLVPDSPDSQHAAYLRQAARIRRQFPQARAGYLRLHPGPVSDAFPGQLLQSPAFQTWMKSWKPTTPYVALETIDMTQKPWRTSFQSGELFSRVVPHATHLAVVILPRPANVGLPLGLILLHLLVWGGWAIRLGMACAGGHPPRLPLSLRFYGLYLLATLLPLSLGIITGIAYLQETRESLVRNLREHLEKDVTRLDESWENLQAAYRSAFQNLVNNRELRTMLQEKGVGHPLLIEAARRPFTVGGKSLPWRGLFFFDHFGATAQDVPPHPGDEIPSWVFRFYRTGLINYSRNQYKKSHGAFPPGPTPISEEDEGIARGYAALGSIPRFDYELEERRGYLERVAEGERPLFKAHHFLHIDGLGVIGVMMFWKPDDLDQHLFEVFHRDFTRRNPEGRPFAFLQQRSRPVPALPVPAEGKALGLDQTGFHPQARPRENLRAGIVVSRPSRYFSGLEVGAWGSTAAIIQRLDLLTGRFRAGILLALAIILGLGAMTWARIGTPIMAVQEGLSRVGAGDFHTRIRLDRQDELGTLTASFDDMIQGLEVRQKFSALVSGKALDIISQAQDPVLAIRGRKMEAALLASDIRDFTTHSESRPAQQITDLLNTHFEEMSRIIATYGGRIDRFIGDAIFAVFDPPFAQDGEGPVRAGMAMLQRLDQINADRERSGLFSYRIGIGIAYGEVIAGGVGDPEIRMDYALLGKPVKESAWLESLSKGAPDLPLIVNQAMAERSGPLKAHFIPLEQAEGKAFRLSPTVKAAGKEENH